MKKYYVEFDFMMRPGTNEIIPMKMKVFDNLDDAKEFAYQVDGKLIEAEEVA